MDEKYLVIGWDDSHVHVRRFPGGSSGPNPRYVRVRGSGEPSSLPVNVSRAEVYRWLASLEEQGFVTEFGSRL